MSKAEIRPADFETYKAMVINSVGSQMWRQGFAYVDGVKTDITRSGELSCALYVSSILKIFDVIERYHANVDSTINDMVRAGWRKVSKPQAGDIICYGAKPDGEVHDHLGFYINGVRVVTNNFLRSKPHAGGQPEIIAWDYSDHPETARPILSIYRGKHLFRH